MSCNHITHKHEYTDDDATPLHHLQGINTIRRGKQRKGVESYEVLTECGVFFLLALVLVQLGRMSKAMSLLDRLEELNILSSDKVSNKPESFCYGLFTNDSF